MVASHTFSVEDFRSWNHVRYSSDIKGAALQENMFWFRSLSFVINAMSNYWHSGSNRLRGWFTFPFGRSGAWFVRCAECPSGLIFVRSCRECWCFLWPLVLGCSVEAPVAHRQRYLRHDTHTDTCTKAKMVCHLDILHDPTSAQCLFHFRSALKPKYHHVACVVIIEWRRGPYRLHV